MGKKANQAQVQNRINYVYKELLEGARPTDIVQNASEKWGLSTRQVWGYVSRANTKIRTEAGRVRKELNDFHLIARRYIMKTSFDKGDHRLAFEVLRDEAKLYGLYEPIKVDWRVLAKEQGVDIDPIYSSVVEEFTAAMVGSDDAGGVGGSAAEGSGATPSQRDNGASPRPDGPS